MKIICYNNQYIKFNVELLLVAEKSKETDTKTNRNILV